MSSGHQRIKWHRNIAENFNRLSIVHERNRQTDRQTTDGRTTTYSEREHEFTFAKNRTFFIKKIILNQLEGFHKCISQLDVVNTCVVFIWNAFIDSLHNPLKILRKKNMFFTFFGQKIKNHIYIKMATIFFCKVSGRVDLSFSRP